MATAPVSRKLNLTRDQLATFLTDQQQIRQFELLFSTVDAIAPDVVLEITIAAGTAQAIANDALAQIAALNQQTAVDDAVLGAKAQEALDKIALVAQETATSVALAENKANQALALVDKLNKAVEGLQMTPPPREFKRARYGQFYDMTTQVAAAINTATAITFDTTDLSNGVSIGTPTSRIVVDTEGIYDFQVSIQIDKTSGGIAEFYIWFRLNGTNVPDSAAQIRIQGNDAEIFSSYNYFFDLKAGDYVEIMFSVSDTDTQLLSVAAVAPVPAIPSIILTVSNNIGGFQ